MDRLLAPAAFAVLAFALSACGQEQTQPDHQNQTARGAPPHAEPQPTVNRDRRQDGPVYTGKSY